MSRAFKAALVGPGGAAFKTRLQFAGAGCRPSDHKAALKLAAPLLSSVSLFESFTPWPQVDICVLRKAEDWA